MCNSAVQPATYCLFLLQRINIYLADKCYWLHCRFQFDSKYNNQNMMHYHSLKRFGEHSAFVRKTMSHEHLWTVRIPTFIPSQRKGEIPLAEVISTTVIKQNMDLMKPLLLTRDCVTVGSKFEKAVDRMSGSPHIRRTHGHIEIPGFIER